jgi:hypothetical protein
MTTNGVGKRKSVDWDSYWDKYRKLLLTVSPMFLALLMLILLNYTLKGPVSPFLISLSFFISGFMGIIIIVRREVPVVLFTIKGTQAIVEGGVVTFFFWGSALYIILQGIF